ncbi:HAD family hydrolase [Acetobacteraceae bacterium]|nr:HAD family hydrolase [Acetobacteraceae bacterium]
MSFDAIPFEKIKLVVFDIDGTLYPQFPIRQKMIIRLLWHSLTHFSFKVGFLIRDYRRLREKYGERETQNFEAEIKETLCKKYGFSSAEYDALILEWFFNKPLPWLLKIRFPQVSEVFSFLKAQNIHVAVLSDYPAKEKIKVLRLEADHAHWAGDPEIQTLKPHPKGLQYIMGKAGVTPEETLMIGDRDDRDGEMARRAGTYFLLRGKLKENPKALSSFTHWGHFLNALKKVF